MTRKSMKGTKDLDLLANGDLTEIGERGINMSGGQKQRIQIARSLYEDADIYLFDDPFSAVDAHTGSQIFQDCVMGILKDKTVLYVTHQVEFLPAADLILLMQDGKIVQKGNFDQLLQQNIGFESIVGAYGQALESVMNAESSSRISSYKQKSEYSEDELNAECETDDQLQGMAMQESVHEVSEDTNEKGKLVKDEEREKGGIDKKVYWAYLRTAHGGVFVPVVIGAQLFFQVFQASNDQSVLDQEIASGLGWCMFAAIQILGTICVMSQMARAVFAIFIPVMVVCILYQIVIIGNHEFKEALIADSHYPWCIFDEIAESLHVMYILQRYQRPAATELTRLTQIQRAPILHHFAESLLRASSIRAYGQKDRFTKANLDLFNNFSRASFHKFASTGWLSLRLNMLSGLVFAVSLGLLVSLPEALLNPGIAGLVVTYALDLNDELTSMIWSISKIENKMAAGYLVGAGDQAGAGRLEGADADLAGVVAAVGLPGAAPASSMENVASVEGLAENGENWSVGQRQLFCLGRVLLKRSNILVLDEATASVDSSTDAIIKEIIHREFGDCTVLTIAHRIHTVIDNDLILVLSEGRIVEYDTPSKLLMNDNSEFSKLVKEYSRRYQRFGGSSKPLKQGATSTA
nr:unnamed protein product [Digitaria exilis]